MRTRSTKAHRKSPEEICCFLSRELVDRLLAGRLFSIQQSRSFFAQVPDKLILSIYQHHRGSNWAVA